MSQMLISNVITIIYQYYDGLNVRGLTCHIYSTFLALFNDQ